MTRTLLCCACSAFCGAFVATSAFAQIHFVEVADAVGATHVAQTRSSPNAGGIALFDFDADGRLDALFTDDVAACHLYRNVPADTSVGFRLVDVSAETSIGALCRGTAVAVVDFDRDGFDDLLVASASGVKLLANRPVGAGGGRVFVDRSALAGFGGEVGAATLSVADYDGDGWPDVYVGVYVVVPRFPMHGCGGNRLYRNRGDGTFEERGAALGASDAGCALAAPFVDVDGDGLLDIVVVNDFGLTVSPSDVLRFDGERFVSMGVAWGAAQRMYGMGVAHGDIDGDGRLDFYVTNIGRNVLLKGAPEGFVDATEAAGVALATLEDAGRVRFRASWGTALADFDLDSKLDLYVGSGYLFADDPIAVAREQPNAVFAGSGDGRFALVPGEADDPRASRGVAIGDLDGDGAPDIVVSNVNTRQPAGPEPRPSIYIARPPASRRRLAVHIRGTVSEPRAGGTRVFARARGGAVQQRDVDTGGASHGSHHDPSLFFGFGDAANAAGEPEEVRVFWASGAVTRHAVSGATSRLDLEEPRWLDVPAVVGVNTTLQLTATPLSDDGAPLGPGHVVSLSPSDGAREGPTLDLGDGRYVQRWRSPSLPGSARVDVHIDGVRARARPMIRVVDADQTAMTVPQTPLRSGTESVAIVEPRDAQGGTLGAGRVVTLLTSAGVPRATEDLGDGTYRAYFVAPARPGTLRLQVVVDGVLQGLEVVVPVVSALDAATSRLEIVYAVASPRERVLVRAAPVDGAGRPSPLLRALTFESDSGDLEGNVAFFRDLFATQWLALSSDVDERVSVRASVGDIRLGPAVLATTGIAAGAPPWIIDAARSRAIALHQSMPADGCSLVRVMAAVRDVNGGFLPATPGTTLRANGGRWRGPATAAIGAVASRCLIAPDAPGEVEVCATVSGVPLGECARISFHAAEPDAPVQDGCGEDALFAIVPETLLDAGTATNDAGTDVEGGAPDAGATLDAGDAVDAGDGSLAGTITDAAADASVVSPRIDAGAADGGASPAVFPGGLPGSAVPSPGAFGGGCSSARERPDGASPWAVMALLVWHWRRKRRASPRLDA